LQVAAQQKQQIAESALLIIAERSGNKEAQHVSAWPQEHDVRGSVLQLEVQEVVAV
jgi:hypothetical protein